MEENSTHRVEAFKIDRIERHPNADTLGLIKFYEYPVVIKLGEYSKGDLVCYIPPDSVVPDTEQFKFLDSKFRVKARRFRGEWSMGLVIPAPNGAVAGEDYSAQLNITHYVPPEPKSQGAHLGKAGKVSRGPRGITVPKYDVESAMRYGSVFTDGEPVWLTEKQHGANARYVCDNQGVMHVGSRTVWKRGPSSSWVIKYINQHEALKRWLFKISSKWFHYRLDVSTDPSDVWWRIFKQYPQIEIFCRKYPGTVLYGEVYGSKIQDLTYGLKNGNIAFAAFDMYDTATEKYWDAELAYTTFEAYSIPHVPVISTMFPYNFEKLFALANGKSLVSGADCMREGICIRPIKERYDSRCGRVHLKIVSPAYLERTK